MPGRSVRVGRIAGIPIGISPLWLVIVALITWSLGDAYFPAQVHGIGAPAAYALGLASALLLFASILAHEVGHAVVARRRGIEVQEIDLWLLGGVARMSGRPQSPDDELRFALAGPLVTAVVTCVFGLLALLVPPSAPAALRALILYQVEVNALILGFNLIPAFPLDGGRVARALLWRRSGDIVSATDRAATVGRWFGYMLIGLAVLLTLNGAVGGLWFAIIGVFVIAAAGAERIQEQVETIFSGVPASELMSRAAVSIPADMTAFEAEQYFARYRYTAFPVADGGGRVVGLLTIEQLERIPTSQRAAMPVSDLMDRDPGLLIDERDDVAQLLGRPAFARTGRAAVVDAQRRLLGIVSITDIQRAMRAARLGGSGGHAAGSGRP